MPRFEYSPGFGVILAEARRAGYTAGEVATLSGATVEETDTGYRCSRNRDYLKVRDWWLWRFHPDEARDLGAPRPPVRFDPKNPAWIPPRGSRGTPRFR